MPTMRVPVFRCGTDWPSWLVGTDPAMEDGEVHRTVCKYSESIKERIKKQKNNNNKKSNNNKQKTKGKNWD